MLKNQYGCGLSPNISCEGKKRPVSPMDDDLSDLDRNPTFFNENSNSCYWFDSRGLSLYLSERNEIFGNEHSYGFHWMVERIFEFMSSNEDVNISRFSDSLLSVIRNVFGLECNNSDGVTLFLPWKSIALIILCGRDPGVNDIKVKIGSREYSVQC